MGVVKHHRITRQRGTAETLTAEERQICSQMGLSEDTFLATRNATVKDR